MKTIYRYSLTPTFNYAITLIMPKEAEILCVQEQKGDPFLWAMIDNSNEVEEVKFEIFGTGHYMPTLDSDGVDIKREYVGTFQQMEGDLVFHCFKIIG